MTSNEVTFLLPKSSFVEALLFYPLLFVWRTASHFSDLTCIRVFIHLKKNLHLYTFVLRDNSLIDNFSSIPVIIG